MLFCFFTIRHVLWCSFFKAKYIYHLLLFIFLFTFSLQDLFVLFSHWPSFNQANPYMLYTCFWYNSLVNMLIFQCGSPWGCTSLFKHWLKRTGDRCEWAWTDWGAEADLRKRTEKNELMTQELWGKDHRKQTRKE